MATRIDIMPASAVAQRPDSITALPSSLKVRVRDRLHIADLRSRKRTVWNRLLLAAALVGPGILVMLGDNDAGGVITYAQTGATNGLGRLVRSRSTFRASSAQLWRARSCCFPMCRSAFSI